jgi:hypothetical protein
MSASFAVLTATAMLATLALTLVSVQLLLIVASALAATVGIGAFGVAMTVGAAGTLIMLAAIKGVASQMKTIAKNAKSAQTSLKSMQASVNAVESGLNALGSRAKSAMTDLVNAFSDAEGNVRASGHKVGTAFKEGLETGLATAPVVAHTAVTTTIIALNSGYSAAYAAGAFISKGFAQGMVSCLGIIQAAANQIAAAADKAVRAKAKINSPSKVASGLGNWWGVGYGDGILDSAGYVTKAAEKLVSIPTVATPDINMAYSGELSAENDYYRNSEYTLEVPVVVDGREVGRATAKYTQDEIEKNQSRDDRRHGKR